MATKAQLKQRCKELEEMLANSENQRDIAENLARARQNYIETLNERIKNDAETIARHKQREMYLEKTLKQIEYIAAHDSVEELTHRERNEKWRHIARMIKLWLKVKHEYMQEDVTDDIPF